MTPEAWAVIATFLGTFSAAFVGTLFRVNKVNNKLTETKGNVEGLSTRVQTLETDNARLTNDLTHEREEKAKIERERNLLSVQVADLSKRIDELATLTRQQGDLLRSSDMDRANLSGRVSEQQVIYTNRIKELDQRVFELQSALIEKGLSEKALTSELATANVKLDDAERKVHTLELQVVALEAQAQSMKGEIERLQAQLMGKTFARAKAASVTSDSVPQTPTKKTAKLPSIDSTPIPTEQPAPATVAIPAVIDQKDSNS